jgi:predicted glycoside hydrolase/deacetylase ChbG (UPF0249 family)
VKHPHGSSLILHADDFGLNAAVTDGIIEAFDRGLLTSTSLLTNAQAAELALDRWPRLEARQRSGDVSSTAARRRLGDSQAPFDLGVHLNLTQGVPLTADRFPSELVDSSGCFVGPGPLFLELCRRGHRHQAAIEAELETQVRWLLDRGVTPTHFNGHQYIEMMPVVSDVIASLAQRFDVPYVRAAVEPGYWHTSLRPGLRVANCCLSHVKRYYACRWAAMLDRFGMERAGAFFGASHAGRIDLALMRHFLRLAGKYAVSEIAFHPGQAPHAEGQHEAVDTWHDPLAAVRPGELALLCSPELTELLMANAFRLGRLAAVGNARRAAA